MVAAREAMHGLPYLDIKIMSVSRCGVRAVGKLQAHHHGRDLDG